MCGICGIDRFKNRHLLNNMGSVLQRSDLDDIKMFIHTKIDLFRHQLNINSLTGALQPFQYKSEVTLYLRRME